MVGDKVISRPAGLLGRLEYWESEQTARIVTMTNTHDDPFERIATMKDLAATVPREAKAAIRAWGNSNPIGRRT